jgi:carbon-monoxide dehydrogenase small subunit
MEKSRVRLKVNGEDREVVAPVHHTLLEVLREEMGLAGTKHGCELGECGTCTVLLDGKPVLSCLTLPVECAGREVTTVEGLAERGVLRPGSCSWRRGSSGRTPIPPGQRSPRPSPATSVAARGT